MFEDTKEIIRSHRKLKKDIQVKRERTNNGVQHILYTYWLGM